MPHNTQGRVVRCVVFWRVREPFSGANAPQLATEDRYFVSALCSACTLQRVAPLTFVSLKKRLLTQATTACGSRHVRTPTPAPGGEGAGAGSAESN